MYQGLKFENEVQLKVISGKTGETVAEWSKDNAISDDVLCAYGHIFITQMQGGGAPWCFLLPDDPIGYTNWTGFTFDRTNPYAPYCATANNSVDTGADPQWQTRQTYTAPLTPVGGRHKLFFEWTKLPLDFQLKALGLTGWQSSSAGGDIPDAQFGAVNQQPTIFIPQTLVVLPSSILIHGRNGGSGTPDILQVSYFLSIVGVA